MSPTLPAHSGRSAASERSIRGHDLSRYVGRSVLARLDGGRHTCKLIAAGTGGLSLVVADTSEQVHVAPDRVGRLALMTPSPVRPI